MVIKNRIEEQERGCYILVLVDTNQRIIYEDVVYGKH